MRSCVWLVVSLAVLLAVAGSSLADPIDYVMLTSGEFGTMDLRTGSFTPIGPASVLYEDLTRLPGGLLYASDESYRLLVINQATGGISSVVGTMGNAIDGLKMNAGGTLFGYSHTDLYRVNPVSAAPTLIGALDEPVGTFHGGAFDGNLMFHQQTNGPGGTSNLYSVNTTTGLASLIGNVGYELNAMDYEGSTLYGFTVGGQIITIDTLTGAGTFLANESSGDVLAAATDTSTPEPSTLVLLGLGSAGIAACRWRARRALRGPE